MIGALQCAVVVALVGCVSGERWRWPDMAGAESVRIDAKVGFVDQQQNSKRKYRDDVQADEASFQEPTDTEGFYNRPPGSGRYPVRVEGPARGPRGDDRDIRINGRPAYNGDSRDKNQRYQDGTLDSFQYCKCVSAPDCPVRNDYLNACGANQYLCCYNSPKQSEYFNEIDDERPMLYPGQSNKAGPFPPPGAGHPGVFDPLHNPHLASGDRRPQSQVLVGPEGPTGIIGPPKKQVLVGPGGPTGVIGPSKPVLVGPQGPTGIIGPENEENLLVRPLGSHVDAGQSETAQRGVLVGPGGPTGIIGPAFNRPILVGPGGPTGIIGPGYNRPVLVGPSGPTGTIGPRLVGPGGPTGIIGPVGFNRPSHRPGVLVGPGGPTGIIGPARQILVGPGGPTGRIGPRNFFGK